MAYIGLQKQIWRNNIWSVILLVSFPLIFCILLYLFFFTIYFDSYQEYNKICSQSSFEDFIDGNSGFCGYDKNGKLINPYLNEINDNFLNYFPRVFIFIFFLFILEYFTHSSMIRRSVGSHGISRKENPEIYNLLENLCISQGMQMPKLEIIEDLSLNAFASGINQKTYTITLSRGIIEKLDKKELEAVMAHELGHIKNGDTRLLIISVVFVGIFSFLAESLFRSLFHSKVDRRSALMILIALVLVLIGYIFTILTRFALSRKREYLADAASAEMTKNPLVLASALRKIAKDPIIEAVKRKDLAQAFIENPKIRFFSFGGMFSTHPPIQKRIEILENF